MTALVRGLSAKRRIDSRFGRAASATAAIAPLVATAAHAQLALSASITSDFRYRGASLGSDQPALTASVGYDVPISGPIDGYFAGAATAGQFPGAGLQVFDHTESLGVAGLVGQGVGWDLGLSDTVLTSDYGAITQNYDPEVYLGVRASRVSFYVHYSPRYFRDDVRALYAELNSTIPVVGQWRLLAHVGALTPFASGLAYFPTREQYDASLGVRTLFRGVGLSAAWTFQRPGYGAGTWTPTHPDALSFMATWYF